MTTNTVPTPSGQSIEGLEGPFGEKIQAMVAASGGRLWINSGFRTKERQAQLYAGAVAKYGEQNAGKYVAAPGHSNHNFGLAVDLGGDLELAHQLAPQFGLTFPMSWEPWHIEPTYARSKRGKDYGKGMTTPPDGVTATHEEPMKQLHNQLYVFNELLKGRTPDEIDAEFATSDTGATGDQQGGTQAVQYGEAAKGGNVDPHELYQALRDQGVDPVHAAALVAIAGRESGFKTGAHNPDASTGDNSYGLFQINLIGGMHEEQLHGAGIANPEQDLFTVQGSAKGAAALLQSGGLSPWGPYKNQSWATGTDLGTGVAASGGEVTLEQLKAIENEGLHG